MVTKYGGLFKTINGGTNWIVLQPPHTTSYQFVGLSCPTNNVVFATGSKFSAPYEQICRSTNGGLDWEGILVDTVYWVYGVYFTSANTGYIAGYRGRDATPNVYYHEGQVFKTTNGGNNWVLKLADSSSIFTSLFFVDQNTGFVVGTHSGTLGKTTDAGESWRISRDVIFAGMWSVYFADANTGVAVGENYIIRTTNGGEPIGIKPIGTEIPNEFKLYQNYPNPFNPNSKIKFQISKSSIVTLKVYDVLGKEIQTLVNEKLSPGTYEVTFNGSNLPSGVYFYRLTAVDFNETKKLILLK
jgi:hypothetical protein